jgi:hypothetical protein
MQFLYKINHISRLCYYVRKNRSRPRKGLGNYYLGNTSYNQINIIFLGIYEFLQEVYQVILKNNITSNRLDKEKSSILVNGRNRKSILGAKTSFR